MGQVKRLWEKQQERNYIIKKYYDYEIKKLKKENETLKNTVLNFNKQLKEYTDKLWGENETNKDKIILLEKEIIRLESRRKNYE